MQESLPGSTPPPLPSFHVTRSHLLTRVLQSRVVCLTAPAGYGKTALLSEAACHLPDHRVFYTAMRAAAAGDTQEPMSDPGELLRLALSGGAPALLLVDDVHLMEPGGPRLRSLDQLLHAASPSTRIMLAGRALPESAALARLEMAGQLLHLGPDELAFSARETERFLAASGGPTGSATALQRRTAGWPAAVSLLGRGSGRRAAASDGAFFRYVAAEVWEPLPPELRQALLLFAVLPELTCATCDGLLGNTGHGESLAELRYHGLAAEDQTTGACRVPPVLAEFLQEQLRRDPRRHRSLHRAACLLESERGNPEQALMHALEAMDHGLQEHLLRRLAASDLREGGAGRLEYWLDRLPEPVLDAVPGISLTVGESVRRAGQPRRARKWFQAAAAGFARQGETSGVLRALCRMALAGVDLGEWAEARAALRQAETELEAAQGLEQAEIQLALAVEAASLGDPAAAVPLFHQAEHQFQLLGETEGAATALAELGSRALVAMGQLPEALAVLRSARSLFGGAAGADAHLSELLLLALQGEWEAVGQQIPALKAASATQLMMLQWLQAGVAANAGSLSDAERFCRLGEAVLPEVDPTPALLCARHLARAWTAGAMGDGRAALEHAVAASQLAEAAAVPLLRRLAARLHEVPSPPETPQSLPLEIECFGSFRVLQGERELPQTLWGRAQVRGLLQYLLLQPGFAAGRDAILEAFWPEEAPSRSRLRLRVTLNRLRQAFRSLGWDLEPGPEVIRISPGAIGQVDLLTFRSHLEMARSSRRHDPQKSILHCRTGRSLYRGELLAGAFWPWADPHRRRCEHELAELLALWHEAAASLGDRVEATLALEELLTAEPGNEAAAARLIRLLLDAGRRSDAILRYRTLETWMQSELGFSPAPATRDLVKSLLK